MKRIEDIKEFEDIDSYYEISDIVAEVFQDRVEAHKHLVTANKEIERLNNIIKEVREIFKDYGDKEDIVGYTMYNITGEQLINILDIVNKALGSDKK